MHWKTKIYPHKKKTLGNQKKHRQIYITELKNNDHKMYINTKCRDLEWTPWYKKVLMMRHKVTVGQRAGKNKSGGVANRDAKDSDFGWTARYRIFGKIRFSRSGYLVGFSDQVGYLIVGYLSTINPCIDCNL